MSSPETPPSEEEPEEAAGGPKKAQAKKAAAKKSAPDKAAAKKATPKKAAAKQAAPSEPPPEPEPAPSATVPPEPADPEPTPVTAAEPEPEVAPEPAPAAEPDPEPEPELEPAAAPAPAAAAEPAPVPEPAPEPEPVDPKFQTLIDGFRESLGDGLVASEAVGGDLWVRVDVSQWRRAAETAKSSLGMDYFCFLSGIDWLPNPTLSGREVWDPNPNEASEVAIDEPAGTIHTGIAGGDTRFQVFARFYSTKTHVGVTIKADLDDGRPTVPSITSVYRGADWHEREAWEMYGFDFDGHPGLRHLYLPGEFEGHPLRKDFPMLAREVKPWPGLVDKEQIPGEAEPAEEEVAT